MRETAPEKEPEEEVEIKDEVGTIKSFDEARGFGFIEAAGGILVGFWLKDQKGDKSLLPGKKKPIKYKRDPKAVSPRAKEWWLVEAPEPPKAAPKPADARPQLGPDSMIRIRAQPPGGSIETVAEDTLWHINGIYPRAPVERHDPINKLRHDYSVGDKLAEVWFEEFVGGNWVKCKVDPRAPRHEERRHKKKKRR